MDTNINIAEILRGMPKGTKLYSPLFGEVTFVEVCDNRIFVLSTNNDGGKFSQSFLKDGSYHSNYSQSECLLFPSSQMRNWSKFAWKKGDVLVNGDRDVHIIFEKFTDNTYTAVRGKYYYYQGNGKNRYYPSRERADVVTEIFSIETESAAQTSYINAIEKRFGGKFNRETLEVEKQSEFKVELKPFDKVLVRDLTNEKWNIDFFGYVHNGDNYPYRCVSSPWKFCIPYNENTKHLLGTTDDWEMENL